MKTLANCNPREFLRQTNRIRHSVEDWLSLTKIMEIRKKMPEVPEGATEEEQRALVEAQVNENLRRMLDAIMDEHPDETAELLGLLCFVEPEDLENHRMTEFLGAVVEMVNCQEVIDFFTTLVRLAQMNGFGAAKT